MDYPGGNGQPTLRVESGFGGLKPIIISLQPIYHISVDFLGYLYPYFFNMVPWLISFNRDQRRAAGHIKHAVFRARGGINGTAHVGFVD